MYTLILRLIPCCRTKLIDFMLNALLLYKANWLHPQNQQGKDNLMNMVGSFTRIEKTDGIFCNHLFQLSLDLCTSPETYLIHAVTGSTCSDKALLPLRTGTKFRKLETEDWSPLPHSFKVQALETGWVLMKERSGQLCWLPKTSQRLL